MKVPLLLGVDLRAGQTSSAWSPCFIKLFNETAGFLTHLIFDFVPGILVNDD